MLKIRVTLYIAIFALWMAACAPALVEASTPEPIKTEDPTIPVTRVAVVQSVEIQILESQPLQVNAILRGQLPDAGCTTISRIEQVRDGNIIRITLGTTTDPLALCAQALTPFEQVVALDVSNLPAAKYTVDVSGVQATLELPARDRAGFEQSLVAALNVRDYDTLKLMMDEAFMLAYWQSEGTSYTSELAVEQLRLNLLNGSAPITTDPNKDLAALLGMDPVRIIGQGVTEVSPLFVSGLGTEGKDEAIIFTAQGPNGSFYWYGMLFAKDGFAKSGAIVMEPIIAENTFATSVQYVMAQRDVIIYNGPGDSHAVVGEVASGQIARVTGTNVNGSWWQIVCPNDTVGSCWVSASFTEPTDAP